MSLSLTVGHPTLLHLYSAKPKPKQWCAKLCWLSEKRIENVDRKLGMNRWTEKKKDIEIWRKRKYHQHTLCRYRAEVEVLPLAFGEKTAC